MQEFNYRLEDVGLNRRALSLKIQYTEWGESEAWYQEKLHLLAPEFVLYSLDELFDLIRLLLPPDHIDLLLRPETHLFWPQAFVKAARYSLAEYHHCLLLAVQLAEQNAQRNRMLYRFLSITDDAYEALVHCHIVFEEREDALYITFPYTMHSTLYHTHRAFWLPDERLILLYEKTQNVLTLITERSQLHEIRRLADAEPPWILSVQQYTPYALKRTLALPAPAKKEFFIAEEIQKSF